MVWAVAWLLVGAAWLVPGTALASAAMLAFMAVFAFGETRMQPTIPAIANDLASDHDRGRSNAINAAAFQGGAITGPVVAGLLLDHGLAELYVGLMVAGCLAICVMAGGLERRISPTVNGVAGRSPQRRRFRTGGDRGYGVPANAGSRLPTLRAIARWPPR